MTGEPIVTGILTNAIGTVLAEIIVQELRHLVTTRRRLPDPDRLAEAIVAHLGGDPRWANVAFNPNDPHHFAVGTFLAFDLRDFLSVLIRAKLAGTFSSLEGHFDRCLADSLRLEGEHFDFPVETSTLLAIFSEAVDTSLSYARNAGVTFSVDEAATRGREEAMVALLAEATSHLRMLRDSVIAHPDLTPSAVLAQLKMTAAAQLRTVALPDLLTARRADLETLYVRPTLVDSASGKRSKVSQHDWASLRTMVLGNPGAGKTTLLRYIGLRTASSVALPAPLIITMRNHEAHIEQGVSLTEVLRREIARAANLTISEDMLNHVLAQGWLLILFDGLDELTSIVNRHTALQQVEALLKLYPQVPAALTSRFQGFDEKSLPSGFKLAVLQDLSSEEVEEYAARWFTAEGEPDLTAEFMVDSDDVTDLRSNPLMLALLCLLYRSSRDIPEKRSEIYARCSRLMFREWDKHRRIEMGAEFDDFLAPALEELAYRLFFGLVLNDGQPHQGSRPRSPRLRRRAASPHAAEVLLNSLRSNGRNAAPESTVRASLGWYLGEWHVGSAREAEDLARRFVDFCKGRLWVLTEVGGDPDTEEPLLGFVHKTFLEYYCAVRLARTASADQLYSLVTAGSGDPALASVLEIALQTRAESYRGLGDELVKRFLSEPGVSPKRFSEADLSPKRLLGLRLIIRSLPVRPATLRELVLAWSSYAMEDYDRLSASQVPLIMLGIFATARRASQRHLAAICGERLREHASSARYRSVIERLLTVAPPEILSATTREIGVSDSVRFVANVTGFLGVLVEESGLELPLSPERVGRGALVARAVAVSRHSRASLRRGLVQFGVQLLLMPFERRDERGGSCLLESAVLSFFNDDVWSRLTNEDWAAELAVSLGQTVRAGQLREFVERPVSSAWSGHLNAEVVFPYVVTGAPNSWMVAEDSALEQSPAGDGVSVGLTRAIGVSILIGIADRVADRHAKELLSNRLLGSELVDFRGFVERIAGVEASDLSWQSVWAHSSQERHALETFEMACTVLRDWDVVRDSS